MTTKTHRDDTELTERERAVEALTGALATDALDEKDYQIREALQLLAIDDE